MKYLKLFEAFESSALNNMVKFLKNKVSDNSINNFKKSLNRVQKYLDIPLSKIQDKDVKYLKRNLALKIKSDEKVSNKKELYCLKFWFSLEEGFLGYTGTGNFETKFDGKNKEHSQERLADFELDILKEKGIETGDLRPVKKLSDLKTGTIVVGVFSDYSGDLEHLDKAYIIEDDDHFYAIQNVSAGGNPSIDSSQWQQYGRFSWSLGTTEDPGSDHFKLHIWTESDRPLNIVSGEVKKEEPQDLDFNLPLDSELILSTWREDFSINSWKKIEQADFAIVVIVDDILKRDLVPVSVTKKQRAESKVGSTKFMTDEQIKYENIDRYFKKIISKFINIDTSEISNLENIILKNLCGKYALTSLYAGRPSFDYINGMSSRISGILKIEDVDSKKYEIERLIDRYKDLNDSANTANKKYIDCFNFIKNSNNEEIKEFFTIWQRISDKIYNYIKSEKIETLQDLRMCLTKLESIKSIMRSDELEFNRRMKNILGEFLYPRDFKSYIENYEFDKFSEDLVSIKYLEKFVDSILR